MTVLIVKMIGVWSYMVTQPSNIIYKSVWFFVTSNLLKVKMKNFVGDRLECNNIKV